MPQYYYPSSFEGTFWTVVDGAYYVSSIGSDTNDGSPQAPFLTVQKAMEVAEDGEKIVVGPNEYVYEAPVPDGGAHLPCRLATTSNFDLSAGGLLEIDGIQTSLQDRVLVWQQTDPTENGIYAASAGSWSRVSDLNALNTTSGKLIPILEGDRYGGRIFQHISSGSISFGTTPIAIRLASESTPKGLLDCSLSPDYPAGVLGDYYYVSVAGKIGGASGLDVSVGTRIECIVPESAGGDEATVGSEWMVPDIELAWSKITERPTTLSGYGITDAATISHAMTSHSATNWRMFYSNGAATVAELAMAATGNALISGGASAAPSWGKIGLTTHISGTLGVGNGGSGATTLTGILAGNGASAFTAIAGTASQLLRRNAGNTAYEFFTPSYITSNQTITLSGDVTGSGTTAITTTIVAGAVDIAMLSASGTPSASTYLRGDNTWAAIAGGGGDVTKVGTPANDQLAVWTGDGTIEGSAFVTYDGTEFKVDNLSLNTNRLSSSSGLQLYCISGSNADMDLSSARRIRLQFGENFSSGAAGLDFYNASTLLTALNNSGSWDYQNNDLTTIGNISGISGNISFAVTAGTIILPSAPTTATTGALRYAGGNLEVYDGTWTAISGGTGDVTKVGTPANDQLGVWTGDGSIEGTSALTFDGSDLKLLESVNDGNPQIRMGSSDAEEFHIQTIYNTGAQTLDYVLFQTDVASGTANKGKYRFNVDGVDILDILDTGISILNGGTGTATDWIATSDERLKDSFGSFGNVLARIQSLKGKFSKFRWKESGAEDVGYGAQTVQAVFPELVNVNDQNVLGLSYGKLGGIALEGVAEVNEEVMNLRKEVAELKRLLTESKG